eukprot:3328550-Prymnesium_polylepis.1
MVLQDEFGQDRDLRKDGPVQAPVGVPQLDDLAPLRERAAERRLGDGRPEELYTRHARPARQPPLPARRHAGARGLVARLREHPHRRRAEGGLLQPRPVRDRVHEGAPRALRRHRRGRDAPVRHGRLARRLSRQRDDAARGGLRLSLRFGGPLDG